MRHDQKLKSKDISGVHLPAQVTLDFAFAFHSTLTNDFPPLQPLSREPPFCVGVALHSSCDTVLETQLARFVRRLPRAAILWIPPNRMR